MTPDPLVDELSEALEETNRSTDKAPAGWEPYSEHTEAIGTAIVRLPTPGATARDLLIQAGFSPDEWQIKGSINTRKWMRFDQEWLYYYKFEVEAGESPEVIQEHVDELVKRLVRRRPRKPAVVGGSDAFGFFASDWQVGKAEGGDGTPQTIDRVVQSVELAKARIKKLRRGGEKMPHGAFIGLGDLVEGACGFYPGQQFLIDRNRRDQGQINRELITHALDELRPLFETFEVAAVGGNHGENRSTEGQRLTDDGDNDDCAVFDAVQEAFERGGSDITWRVMGDELSMLVELGGVPVGLTHGHLFQRGKGATAGQKATEWWKGQEFGFHPVRGARVLVTAHFHHFLATSTSGRTHFQTPAMDPGSKWFREATGEWDHPGVLTMRFDAETRRGFADLEILSPSV